MPGIISMESGGKMEEEGDELASNQDSVACRKTATITDFFKQPVKSQPGEEKKSTLLSYFSKTQSPPHSAKASKTTGGMVTAAPLDTFNLKSSHGEKMSGNGSDLDEKEDRKTTKTNFQLKEIPAPSTNQQTKSLLPEKIVSENEKSEADVPDVSQGHANSGPSRHGKKSKKQKHDGLKKNIKSGVSEDVVDELKVIGNPPTQENVEEKVTPSEDICEISYQDFLHMTESDGDDVTSKEKRSIQEVNESVSVINADDCSRVDSKSEGTTEGNAMDSVCMEVSYQEFLEDSSVKNESHSKDVLAEDPLQTSNGEAESEELGEDNKPIPDNETTTNKKPQLGIGHFFKKLEGPQLTEKKNVRRQLTVTADVHSSSSEMNIKKSKKNKEKDKSPETSPGSDKSNSSSPRSGKRRSNVVAAEEELDLEIIQLGRYDIEPDKKSASSVKVSTMDKEGLEEPENDQNSVEEQVFVEAPKKQLSENAKAFLTSKSTVSVSQKSTQATIMFTAKGFQMGVVKAPKEEENQAKENSIEEISSEVSNKTRGKNKKKSGSTSVRNGEKCNPATMSDEEVLLLTPLKKNELIEKKPVAAHSDSRVKRSKREHPVEDDIVKATPTRKQKSQENKSLKVDDDIVEATPSKMKKNMKKKGNKPVSIPRTLEQVSTVDEDSHDSIPMKTPRRQRKNDLKPDSSKKKALKSVFKATVSKKKGDGLKMTITRVRGRDQEEEEIFTPKSSKCAKVKSKLSIQGKNKAQELLLKAKTNAKAKKKCKKAKSNHVEEKTENVRRSSRHCAQLANQALQVAMGRKSTNNSNSSYLDENEVVVIKEKNKCPRPKKQGDTPNKKTPKKAVKLASIFQPKGSSDLKEKELKEKPKKILSKEEEAALQARRQFLLSSVPEPLKKQSSLNTATTPSADYPPFPTNNHVQQKTDTDSKLKHLWDLQAPKLPVKFCCEDVDFQSVNKAGALPLGMFTEKNDDGCVKVDQSFAGHEELDEQTVKVLLTEISAANQGFPIKRVYRSYQSRRQMPWQNGGTAQVKEQANALENKKKRKQPDSDEVVEIESNKKKRKKDTANSDCQGKQTTRRRSNRLQSSSDTEENKSNEKKLKPSKEDDCIVLGDSPEKPQICGRKESEGVSDKELMWTEKYAPTCSADIIGNPSAVARLKTWLTEWKHRMDRDARKLQKMLLKEAKQKKKKLKNKEIKEGSQDWWTDDERDFIVSDTADSDYEEEEESYCNTMLIQGPHGVGKTTSVHALARELGYKVFEVNASARRSGKHIISQLQEATQSHQVCKKNLEKEGNPITVAAGIGVSSTKSNPEKKLPTTFANFFTKTTSTQNTGAKTTEDSKSKKKVKQDLLTEKRNYKVSKKAEKHLSKNVNHVSPKKSIKSGLSQGRGIPPVEHSQTGSLQGDTKKGLNLSKTSLILFEEVDVAFEEDKGFWAAIQTIMDTTKIPILLVTSDPNFSDSFVGNYEQLIFKTPSLKNTASYLQVMCLAENLRSEYNDIYKVVEFHHGDIRQSILALQFLVTSGGGITQRDRSVKLIKPVSSDSDLAFSRKRKLKRGPIIEDDSSCSLPSTPKKASQPLVVEDSRTQFPEDSQDGSEVNLANVKIPLMHMNCLHSLIGINEFSHFEENLTSLLKTPNSTSIKEKTLQCLEQLGVDIIHANFPSLIPLPHTEWSKPSYNIHIQMPDDTEVVKKRKRILEDVFDSEGSDNEFQTLPKRSHEGIASAKGKLENISPDGDGNDDKALIEDHSAKKNPRVNPLVAQCIEGFSNYYDTCSYMDSYMTLQQGATPSQDKLDCLAFPGRLIPGLSDEFPSDSDGFPLQAKSIYGDMVTSVKMANLHVFSQRLSQVMVKVKKLKDVDQELAVSSISVPVKLPAGSDSFVLGEATDAQASYTVGKKKAAENVICNLPAYLRNQKMSVAMDYIPMLRTVCKMEQFRKSSKVKRRFFHYLDSIGLQLKQSSIDTLCSSF